MSAIITVQGVEKSFGTRRVLAGVSFAVHDRDRIGLIGLNGSGKSTLLRLIVGDSAGREPIEGPVGGVRDDQGPDAGLITRRRDLSLEYVPQEPRLDGERTVIETLREGLAAHADALTRLTAIEAEIPSLEGSKLDAALEVQAGLHEHIASLGGFDQDHEIRGLAAALQLPPFEALIGKLSGGERRRVALARALLARPEVLALDEPTNHLDAETVEWLEVRLRAHAGALLLVTHDRYFLDRVATRILEIDRGKLYAYEGSYTRFLEKQAERLQREEAKERARASFVRNELDWIRRGPQARTTKQQARIDRFDTAVAARPAAGDKRQGPMSLRLPTGQRLGKTILELHDVSKSIPGRLLFEHLSLIMKPGDRIGIIGPNGAGKTTLLRVLLGSLPPDSGQVVMGQNSQIAFLDQARAELRDDRTVLEEVAGGNDHVFLEEGPVHVRTFLRMMLFDDGFADTPVGTLSGGERNRVQLAKLLRAGANFLVLDEPTNDLDLVTLGVLEGALAEFPGCALVVSHDRWFLDRVATGILSFEGQGRVVFYEGNYSDWLARRPRGEAAEKKAEERKARAEIKAASAALPNPTTVATPGAARATPLDATPKGTTARKASWKEQRELLGMEEAILGAETRVAELQARLEDPTLYRDRGAEVPGLVASLDAARAEVERLYARWQELEALAR